MQYALLSWVFLRPFLSLSLSLGLNALLYFIPKLLIIITFPLAVFDSDARGTTHLVSRDQYQTRKDFFDFFSMNRDLGIAIN